MAEGGCAKGYRGLPVTSAAIIFPFFYLVGLWIPDSVMLIVNHILPLVTGVLFILDFHVPTIDIGRLFSKKADDKSNA